MFKQYHFGFAILIASFSLELLVHAQNDQSGFISLDCGLPRNSNYTEPTTQIYYISDAPFITTGTSHSIAPKYKADRQEQAKTLRSFPEGIRNCYKINVTKKTRYLIRATFFHGNYDGQDSAPQFDLNLGANFWDTVKVVNVSLSTFKEIIHIPSQDYVHVCLVNTGLGTPFISDLEFRPMSSQVYYNNSAPSESLELVSRLDIGSASGPAYGYPYDFLDRIWLPNDFNWWTQISTSQTIDPKSKKNYRPPSIVMSTAATPVNESNPMEFYLAADTSTTFYFYLHFAELQQLKSEQYRAFNINLNGELWYGPLAPVYLNTTTITNQIGFSGSSSYNFSIIKLENSTLPPILNGFEAYSAVDFQQSETNEKDVDAITNIKSTYGVKKNWDGDPCVPKGYLWTGLNCSYNGFDPPRIIALNLSSSGLTGKIAANISKLSMIQSLDLSDNNLTGSVPDFLAQLPNLRVLVGANLNLCASSKCKTKKNSNILIPVVASVGGLVLLLFIAAAVLLSLKKKKRQAPEPQKDSLEPVRRQFTFAEVQRMTNNFERILGKGGFGAVYYGSIDDNTQVKLVMKVYHRNLTSLVGYCNEGTNMAFIYEYMANGDLGAHLSGESSKNMLSWEGRLHIAADAAQGLEYLHSGCKPPIVHRDVKTPNILLTDNFQAKLADFGLSRSFPTQAGSHVSTVVAGTPGYLDPAYYTTNRLTEKSDVYSYGVVLLEIITNQPAIISSNETDERTHISHWVSSRLANGLIRSIVDPRLQGDFEVNSVWKAVEIAMVCLSPSPSKRPNMSEVVSELKKCLAAEFARKNQSRVTDLTDSNEVLSLDVTTELSPLAR
ncbi:putative LRR receptor-like serine/threonine-protein kinase [Morus notabilis]|uniref:non-specific serine/threonine protein kinase n=1 Tax=Morus notabilis TaxID=981085 RepID=W9RV56_9ROSA|nr:putative LRR receptor-like serine/threonine-protein kinase [Morus notabilis]